MKSILTDEEILAEIEAGNIVIEDFCLDRLNPNSYNLTLHNELEIYETDYVDIRHGYMPCAYGPLDMARENPTSTITIPDDGLVIYPGRLYLGRTKEKTTTSKFVPVLDGRSSVGRLGLFVHATAGYGDLGFHGYWTLEISCIQPIKIYPDVPICQVRYHTTSGKYMRKYSGKYQNNEGIQASKLYLDFKRRKS